jgi:choline dehydrogenase
MLSGVGDPDELQRAGVPVVAALPGVGRNLRDHPLVVAEAKIDGRLPESPRGMTHQHILFYTSPGYERPNDIQIQCSYTERPGGDPGKQEIVNFEIGLQMPTSVGRLYLHSDNPLAQPTVVFGYLEDAVDGDRLIAALRSCAVILQTEPCRELGARGLDPAPADYRSDGDLRAWLRRNIRSAFHSTGTCSMGVAQESVVDETCHVHGVSRLRIGDLSIVPTNISNAGATALMIGERLADLIADDD